MQTVCVIDIISDSAYTETVTSVSQDLHNLLYSTLGEKIKKARKESGMTQAKLAEESTLSRTSITNIEKGRQHLPLHTLYEIAAALGKDVSELLPKLHSHAKQDLSDKLPDGLHAVEREWIENIVSNK